MKLMKLLNYNSENDDKKLNQFKSNKIKAKTENWSVESYEIISEYQKKGIKPLTDLPMIFEKDIYKLWENVKKKNFFDSESSFNSIPYKNYETYLNDIKEDKFLEQQNNNTNNLTNNNNYSNDSLKNYKELFISKINFFIKKNKKRKKKTYYLHLSVVGPRCKKFHECLFKPKKVNDLGIITEKELLNDIKALNELKTEEYDDEGEIKEYNENDSIKTENKKKIEEEIEEEDEIDIFLPEIIENFILIETMIYYIYLSKFP
jgi:hypothetical protein